MAGIIFVVVIGLTLLVFIGVVITMIFSKKREHRDVSTRGTRSATYKTRNKVNPTFNNTLQKQATAAFDNARKTAATMDKQARDQAARSIKMAEEQRRAVQQQQQMARKQRGY